MFELNGKMDEKLSKWLKKHDKKCPYSRENLPFNKTPAIGGRLAYNFVPNGIGMEVSVKCACGETVDLTDVDSW